VAARLVADIVQDFESELTSLTVRPFDDGRFIVLVGESAIFDKERTGRFPKYQTDVKPGLEAPRPS
jgi:predicted Rdx family selenoprotein